MKVFCPNCGQANEGEAGASVACTACATLFDAPSRTPGATEPARPVSTQWQQPQVQSQVASPQPVWQPAPVMGTGSSLEGQRTNTLAIVSLVSGILCCIPFAGLVALVTGFLGIKQIDANPGQQKGKGLAIAGMVLGALSILMAIIGILISATTPRQF